MTDLGLIKVCHFYCHLSQKGENASAKVWLSVRCRAWQYVTVCDSILQRVTAYFDRQKNDAASQWKRRIAVGARICNTLSFNGLRYTHFVFRLVISMKSTCHFIEMRWKFCRNMVLIPPEWHDETAVLATPYCHLLSHTATQLQRSVIQRVASLKNGICDRLQ